MMFDKGMTVSECEALLLETVTENNLLMPYTTIKYVLYVLIFVFITFLIIKRKKFYKCMVG